MGNEKLSEILGPILKELESIIQIYNQDPKCEPPEFDDETFRAIVSIFLCGMSDKSWAKVEREDMPTKEAYDMGEEMHNIIGELILKYTDIKIENI